MKKAKPDMYKIINGKVVSLEMKKEDFSADEVQEEMKAIRRLSAEHKINLSLAATEYWKDSNRRKETKPRKYVITGMTEEFNAYMKNSRNSQ